MPKKKLTETQKRLIQFLLAKKRAIIHDIRASEEAHGYKDRIEILEPMLLKVKKQLKKLGA